MPVSLAVHNAMLEKKMEDSLEEAIKYFNEVRASFFTPNLKTYEILVYGFLKHNQFNSALSIYGDLMHESSPFDPSPKMVHSIVKYLIETPTAKGGDKEGEKREVNGDLLFRILRDVRLVQVELKRETYLLVLLFLLDQPHYPVGDIRWILGHAEGDQITFSEEERKKLMQDYNKCSNTKFPSF